MDREKPGNKEIKNFKKDMIEFKSNSVNTWYCELSSGQQAATSILTAATLGPGVFLSELYPYSLDP